MRMSYVAGGKHIRRRVDQAITGYRVFKCVWQHLDDRIREEGRKGILSGSYYFGEMIIQTWIAEMKTLKSIIEVVVR